MKSQKINGIVKFNLSLFLEPILIIGIALVIYAVCFYAVGYEFYFKYASAFEYEVIVEYLLVYIIVTICVRVYKFYTKKIFRYYTMIDSALVVMIFLLLSTIVIYPMAFILIMAPIKSNLCLHFFFITMLPWMIFKVKQVLTNKTE